MSLKFIKTNDNNVAAVIDGYVYYFAKENKKQLSKRYRCRVAGCSCSVTIADDVTLADRVLRHSKEHDHPQTAKEDDLYIKKIIGEMKLAAEIEEKSLQDIYDDGLIEYKRKIGDDEALLELFPEFESIKSTLYLHQKKKYPKLPQSCDDIDLDGEYGVTSSDKKFVISKDEDVDKCLVFASELGLTILSKCNKIGGDGTFYVCPNLYSQMYTIMESS
jgi:hypothetical protein